MKISSKNAYKEWNKLPKKEQKVLEREACAFGFNCASEGEDGEETYDIGYLHIIAEHVSCERSVDSCNDILNKIYLCMEKLQGIDSKDLFSGIRSFNRLINKIKDITENGIRYGRS
jgi:hypothetical protein